MKRLFLDLVSSLLLGLGALLLCSPVLLAWWIHGDYERYVWILNGPFQLFMYVGLFAAGVVLVVLSLLFRVSLRGMR